MQTAKSHKIDQLLDAIHRSELVAPEEMCRFLTGLSTAAINDDDPVKLARKLIAEGLLTPFQCEQLLRGRWRNFQLAGKYKVLARLGSGATSTVLLCEHMVMRRLVALKVLPAEKARDPAILARFRREARASARLRHPNVVTVYDLDSVDGMDYLVAEFVDGSDLQKVVEMSGPMSLDRAANCILQAAEGLHHAHEMGLVHRDIKPSNLVLDRSGTIKLLDLGMARLFNTSQSGTGADEEGLLMGTIDYVAPEQALDSKSADIRADIYSLGATAYFLLSGRSLFEGATTIQKLAMHSHCPPESIVARLSGVPPTFAAILIKMLAKDPSDRFQTPGEVALAMAPWTTEHVHVPPDEEMPVHPPAIRAAIDHSGSVNGLMGSRSRSWVSLVGSGAHSPPTGAGPETGPASDPARLSGFAGLLARKPWIGLTLAAVSLLALSVAFWSGRTGTSTSRPSGSPSGRLALADRSSPFSEEGIPLIKQGRFLKLSLDSVATVITTRALFHDPQGPQADGERLDFDDWSPRSFRGVPFQLVDPQGDEIPNAIMLHSPQGVTPPKMPSLVSLKINTRARAIHFLGGISGWGAKSALDPQTTSMIVRLIYEDDESEDHPLKNGIHFSDFTQNTSVPGSMLAFRLKDRHLRYFSITPQRLAKIARIDLVKGPDETAPIVMAITLEEAVR